MKKKKLKNEKIRITDSFIGHGGSEIGSNKLKFEQLKVRITEGFFVEFVKEYPQGMKNGSNKREVRTSAGSNNWGSAVLINRDKYRQKQPHSGVPRKRSSENMH